MKRIKSSRKTGILPCDNYPDNATFPTRNMEACAATNGVAMSNPSISLQSAGIKPHRCSMMNETLSNNEDYSISSEEELLQSFPKEGERVLYWGSGSPQGKLYS
jgi:hypothetical protein